MSSQITCLFCGFEFSSSVFCPQSGLRHSDLFREREEQSPSPAQRRLAFCEFCSDASTPFCCKTGRPHSQLDGNNSPVTSSSQHRQPHQQQQHQSCSTTPPSFQRRGGRSPPERKHSPQAQVFFSPQRSIPRASPGKASHFHRPPAAPSGASSSPSPPPAAAAAVQRRVQEHDSDAEPSLSPNARALHHLQKQAQVKVVEKLDGVENKGGKTDVAHVAAPAAAAAADEAAVSALAAELRQQQQHLATLLRMTEAAAEKSKQELRQPAGTAAAPKRHKPIPKPTVVAAATAKDIIFLPSSAAAGDTDSSGSNSSNDERGNDRPRLDRTDGFGLFSSSNPALQRIHSEEVTRSAVRRDQQLRQQSHAAALHHQHQQQSVGLSELTKHKVEHEKDWERGFVQERVEKMSKLYRVHQDALLERNFPAVFKAQQKQRQMEQQQQQQHKMGDGRQKEDEEEIPATAEEEEEEQIRIARAALSAASADEVKKQQQEQEQKEAQQREEQQQEGKMKKQEEMELEYLRKRSAGGGRNNFAISAPRSSGGVLGHIAAAGSSSNKNQLASGIPRTKLTGQERFAHFAKQFMIFAIGLCLIVIVLRGMMMLKQRIKPGAINSFDLKPMKIPGAGADDGVEP